MPRRVLFIECSPGFGGSGAALARLISHLDPERYRAHAVVSCPIHRDHFAAQSPVESVLVDSARLVTREAGVGNVLARTIGRCGPLGNRFVSAAMIGYNLAWPVRSFVRRVQRFFSDVVFDAVWLNNGVMNNYGAGALLARRWGVPLVCKVQGFHYVSALPKWLARPVDMFLPDSWAVAERLLAMGVPRNRITPTYCPVDVGEFDPARVVPSGEFKRFGAQPDALAFGIIGQLLEWKGQQVFLDAAKRVFNSLPDSVAVIVGAEPDRSGERMKYLRDRAERLGIADRILFTGHRNDISQVMAELDVVVHASIEPEPFGTVIAEAMAMKKAVVAMRAGGPIDYVQDGVNGLLSDPADAGQMAEAILRLLRDADLRRRLGESGRRTVVERFSAERHARDTQALLDSVIDARQVRRKKSHC